MAEREIDNMPTVSDNAKSEIEDAINENYKIVSDVEERADDLVNSIKDIRPEKFDPCSMGEIMEKLNNVLSSVGELLNELSSIKILKGMERFFSFQLVAKKFQIIQLKMKRTKLFVEMKLLEMKRKMIISASNGTANNDDPDIAAITAAYAAAAAKLDLVFAIIEVILKIVESLAMMFGVDGCGMSFFMTPKSLQATKLNMNGGTLNCADLIPDSVKDAISEIEASIDDAIGEAKSKIMDSQKAAGALAAAASVTESADLPPITMDSLPTAETIHAMVMGALNLVIEPEAMPRYEKLLPINPKWMLFLLSSFEPAMKQSFGMPGMP